MADSQRTSPWIYVAIVVLLGAAGFLGWRLYELQHAEAPVTVAPPPVVASPTLEVSPALSMADGDALLKSEGAGLSSEPELASWLAQPDLVRRLVGAVVQVGNGESPREMLAFLGPPTGFSVVQTKTKTFMSPTSTARYDGVARVIGSIDAAKLGALYLKLRPFAESAFREVAPPGKTFDATFLKAVEHLAAVPLRDEPLELAPLEKIVGFRYVDPALEALTPAQKHLVRMGPANARVIVARLREFRSAVAAGLPDAGQTDQLAR